MAGTVTLTSLAGPSQTIIGPSISGATITTSTYNGNTLTTGSSTYTGTAGQTYTFPTTSATMARTDAANTFTGTQTIGALVATTINGNTITTGSSTFTGTAGQTYTFPTTTATIARTNAAQTFTGAQTFGNATQGILNLSTTGTYQIDGGSDFAGMDYRVPTGAEHSIRVNSINILSVTGTGAAITGLVSATTRFQNPSFTVGTMPSAATAGGTIYVSDAAVAPCLAFTNGTNWKRCDNAATTVI